MAATDLNARIDLNRADDSTLAAFFRQFAGDRETRSIVDALGDWKDADDLVRADGAEAQQYQRARSPWVPRNGPLERLEELRRVHGVSDALARAVAPYVSVAGDGRINVNTAPESVLAAVPALGRAGARFILSRRRSGEFFPNVGVIARSFGRRGSAGIGAQSLDGRGMGAVRSLARLSVEPSRILVVSRGWLRGHPLTREIQAVFALNGRRLVLQSWRERDR